MIKLGAVKKFIAILANFSLFFNSLVPFLLVAQPVYAQEASSVETTVTVTEAAPTEAPVLVTTNEVTPEITITPEITPEVITVTPEVTITPEITPTPELTPTDVPITTEVGTLTPPVETITPTPETISTVSITPTPSSWTFEKVELNKEYIAPQNSQVKLTFTKLPENSGNLKIEEITLTQEQIKQTGSLSDKAYDITSDMIDGTFAYNLSLPIPESSKGKAVDVKYTENISQIDSIKTANNTTETDSTVFAVNLDHFTIFIVTETLPSGVSNGGSCTVASISGTCYDTIQAAINAASSGDTINVAAGTYNLTLPINVNKAVSIVGDENTPANVVINAPTGGSISGANSAFVIISNNVTIKGFRIQGALHTTTAQNAGIYVNDQAIGYSGLTGITITKNEITNNGYGIIAADVRDSTFSYNNIWSQKKVVGKEAESGVGVVIYGRKEDSTRTFNLIIDHNNVYDNETEGIRVDVESAVGATNFVNDLTISITNNTVYNNGSTIGGVDKYVGIKSAGWSKGVTVSGNEIYGHTGTTISATSGNAGIQIFASKGWSMDNNNIHDNLNGIFFAYSTFDSGSGSHTISNNNIHANVRGISIDDGTEAVANNKNSIYSNDSTAFSGIGFTPHGVYNSGSGTFDATNNWWGSAVKVTIQSKISSNVDFEPYYVNSERSILSSTAPSSVYVDSTYFDGSADGHNFGYDAFATIQDSIDAIASNGTINVTAGTYTENQILIDKPLTLQGAGRANTIIDGGGTSTGGLVNITASGAVTLSGFTIQNTNNSDDHGHGVYVNNASVNVIILNNAIKNVGPVGINVNTASSVQIEGNIISALYSSTEVIPNGIQIGYPDGAGITGTIKNNEISGCSWIGYDADTDTYENSDATSAGILIMDTTAALEILNNVIHDNNVGIDIEAGASTEIKNNDIHDNAYGVVLWNQNPSINNNKIENNSQSGVYRTSWGVLSGTVDATNNWWGSADPNFGAILSGNITYDPYYIDNTMTKTNVQVDTNLTTAKTNESTLISTDYADYSAVTTALALPETNNSEKITKTNAINGAISGLITVASIFNTISSTLTSNSIANNLNTVTGSNWKKFNGLYFEKSVVINGVNTKMGKITFTSELDLSKDETTTFLKNLGTTMDMAETGVISLDFSGTTSDLSLKGKTAKIEFYGLDKLGFTVDSTSDEINSKLVAYDDNGNILNKSDLVNTPGVYTPPVGVCEVGGACYIFSVDVNHFTKYKIDEATQTTNSSSNNDGGSTSASAPVCNDSKPGSAPVLLSVVAGVNSVTLSWSKSTNPVSYYLVAYGTKSGSMEYGNPNVGNSDTTSYTIKGLSGGTTYYFKVRAGNGCMPGDFSNELSTRPNGFFIETPATGFEPNVLGETTTESNLNTTPTATPAIELGNILGSSKNKEFSNWWWLLLLGIIPLYVVGKKISKKK